VALEDGVSVVFCTACGAVHHDDCWDENDGCAVALCAGGPSLRADDEGDEAESPTVLIPPPPPPSALPLGPAALVTPPPNEAPPPPPPTPGPGTPGPGRSRRNLIPLIAIGIVLLGGGAAGAIVLGGSHGSSSTTVETAAAPVSDSELSASEEPLEGEEEEFESESEYEPEEELEPELSPSQLAQRQVQQALRGHFNNLASGYYHAAYHDLTPTEGEEIGGESSWVGAQEEDQLQDFELQVNTTLFDSNAARARIVEFETNSLATGCKQWSGYWEMSRVYGEWLISAAKLEDESC
jgi:hypothetical protein